MTDEEIKEEGFSEIVYIKIKKTKLKTKKNTKTMVKKKTTVKKYSKRISKKDALKINGKTKTSPCTNLGGGIHTLDTRAGGSNETLDTGVEREETNDVNSKKVEAKKRPQKQKQKERKVFKT